MSVLKLAPNFVQKAEILFKLAVIFGRTYQLDQAINYFNNALQELPENFETGRRIDIFAKLGICFEEKKEYTDALKSYESALALDSKNTKPLLHLAWCHYLMNNHPKALEISASILLRDATNSDAYYIKGRAMLQLKKCAEAQECFSQAVANDEKNVVYVNSLGVALCLLGEFGKALTEFSKGTKINSKVAEIWLNLGMLHEHNKEYSEAESAYNEGLKIIPESSMLERRKNSLKEEIKAPIEFVHMEYRVSDSMVPMKEFANNQFLRKGAEAYFVQNSSALRNGLPAESKAPKTPVKEKIKPEKEEAKVAKKDGKEKVIEVKHNTQEKPQPANKVKNSEQKQSEPKEPKEPEVPSSKPKSNSANHKGNAQGHVSQSSAPKPKPAAQAQAEVGASSQHGAQVQASPSVPSADFGSAMSMQQFGMVNPLVQPMLSPYDIRAQAPNAQMMFYMQNPMLGPKYSIMGSPQSMPFVSMMPLQQPGEVSQLYQVPGMPQGGMMVMAPYGLPNAAQMTRPEASPYMLTMPRPSYISPEQYQGQIAGLQRTGQPNGGTIRPIASHPMMAPSFYPMVSDFSGRIPPASRFPEGLGNFPVEGGRGPELQPMGYAEDHANSHGRQRLNEHSRIAPPGQTRSNTGLKKARYE
eukprot:TRINITY_DN10513_c0_g1_i2.p1 TRINITY_DN10513_c0_g1~~TRINITY_DN10513_c0_g1_i2.p1  ORF type:complete len:641 (+),score=120.79 TRINITY_DN10513_c0_g1_i2:679-2601(+)